MKTSSEHIGPIQEQWLQSLEQHPERQMKHALGEIDKKTGEYKACCLGELGLIAGVCVWKVGTGRLVLNIDEYQTDALADVWDEVGLYGPNGNADNSHTDSLAWLNDNGKSWPEIAAIIRADPKLYLKEPK
jgi:hypothetical protein